MRFSSPTMEKSKIKSEPVSISDPMEKRVEFMLPEGIIQDIQSRMSGKEDAQTSLISKSWHAAWKTGSHLYFDQQRFYSGENEFWQLVCKTMQRYVKSKLWVDSLSLWMYGDPSVYHLAKKIIAEAMQLGAADLHFCIHLPETAFELPHEVLGSDTLTRLSVMGCRIRVSKVNCLRLKSLCIENVWVQDNFLRDIISMCPLIDKLSLCICPFYHGTKESKNFHSYVPSFVMENLLWKFEPIKLKCLSLCGFRVRAMFFDKLSTKFLCLKELAVHDCNCYERIQISSPSLECISISQDNMLRAKFDVPSIRKFIFSSGRIPSLLFDVPSIRKWESDISIKRVTSPSSSWFIGLSKFLAKLSMSRVSLSLRIMYKNGHMYVVNIQGVPKPLPVVENLSVDVPLSSVCPALFDCLFLCCCPIFVTPTHIGGERKMELLEVVHKRLLQQIKSNAQDDLEEVMVEVEASSGWQPLVFDDSTQLVDGQRIRFHLKWRDNAAAFK